MRSNTTTRLAAFCSTALWLSACADAPARAVPAADAEVPDADAVDSPIDAEAEAPEPEPVELEVFERVETPDPEADAPDDHDAGDDDAEGIDADDAPADTDPPVCPPPALGVELAPGTVVRGVLDACGAAAHALVIARGMQLTLVLTPAFAGATVSVLSARALDGEPAATLDRGDLVRDGALRVEVTALPAGERLVEVADRARPGATYTLEVRCTAGCDREATRSPVVLLHGYAGTDRYLGIIGYFSEVEPTLERLGYEVFTTAVNPNAEAEDRAAELLGQLVEIVEATRSRKLNLIAHSQGGLDARVLISGRGLAPRVATLTTVATPHRGMRVIPEPFFLVRQNFTWAYMRDSFNPTYPDMPGVAYFSWGGASCGALDADCRRERDGEAVDPILLAQYFPIVKAEHGDNDGLVPVESARWGTYLGTIWADHYDEIGQLPADPYPHLDHLAFYTREARRLKAAGY